MIFFILLMYGLLCAQSISALTPPPSDKYHFYFLANYNQLENQNTKAQQYYDILFKNYTTPHIYPGYLIHLAKTNQFETIIKLIPTLESSHQTDLHTEIVFIGAYEAMGNQPEVIERLTKLSKKYPENSEIIFYTAGIYAEKNLFAQALAAIDSYLTAVPTSSKNFLFYFLKAQIYMRAGNQEQALYNVKKSLELFPKFEQGWLLLGLLHELAGDLDAALKNYQTSLNIVGQNPLLERQIMLLQLKRQQAAHQETNKEFMEALRAYDNKEYQKALQLVQQSPVYATHIPSRLLSIELLCKINSVDKALALLTDWIKADQTNDVWYRALHLLYKAGIPSTVIVSCLSRIEKEYAASPLPSLYIADIYLRENDIQNATIFLNKALAKAQEPLLKTKILFQLSLLFYKTKKWDDMHKALVQANSLGQNYAPLLNLLAYYYATKGEKLQEAEILIQAALKQDKNPHFLDTYALILYKKNDLDAALKIWQSIIKQVPHDSTILYHLAKTFHKKGHHDTAAVTLTQAIHYCSAVDEKDKYQKCLATWNKK